jgi:tetratricopeptide (TPR) repeat protein
MPSPKALILCLWMILLGLCGTGCVPPGGSGQDEEGDPDYRVGLNRKQAGNYTRAIDSFERALAQNPQSAAANFELGLIYYQNVTNYVAAIYHFDRVQRLKPGFRRIDVVRSMIKACKQELVRDAMVGFTVQMQREMERLEQALQDNAALRQEVAQLRAQLSHRETDNSPRTEPGPGDGVRERAADLRTTAPAPAQLGMRVESGQTASRRAATIYTVKTGDTLYSIARRHGMSAAELRSANPGVVPTLLRAGQELRIPAR